MGTLAFLLAMAAIPRLLYSHPMTTTTTQRPNIILIMSDDMGFSDIQPYGGEIQTPHLQRLAENGLRFTQFYNTARCCPTRASLLTGLYPHQAGIGWMMVDRDYEGYRGNLNRNCVTIAEALRPVGYSTYMAGKWHVTPYVKPNEPKDNWPCQRGFDHFYGTIHGAGSFYDPNSLTRDNTQISPYADTEYQPETYYYTDAISDHAVRFIDTHAKQQTTDQQKPFFLYIAYTAAHWPMHALPKDIAKYSGKYDQGYRATRQARLARMKQLGLVHPETSLPADAENWDAVEQREWELACMEVYAAMIDNMDQGIGRIIGKLEECDQLDNTLIFFLQDNGGCAEPYGRQQQVRPENLSSLPVVAMPADELQTNMQPKTSRDGKPVRTGAGVMPGPADTYIGYGRGWANVSNTPFREYKHWVHEGGISTPLIVHWPQQIHRKGELDHQPGHLIDIMATCLDVGQASYPKFVLGQPIKPLQGRSLVPAFEGKQIERDAIYWEHEGNRAVRVGNWKLVAKENSPWELYDIAVDRIEAHDLSQKFPEKVSELSAKWDSWAARSDVLPLGAWRSKSKDKGNSQQLRFQLNGGESLSSENAPTLHGRAFQIHAKIREWGPDGVIVAQGGSAHGYALYAKSSRLCFATRTNGTLNEVQTAAPLSSGQVIEVRVRKNGNVVMRVDGTVVHEAVLAKILQQMPADGLQVGRDEKGLVGAYADEFPYQGKIDSILIEIDDDRKRRN